MIRLSMVVAVAVLLSACVPNIHSTKKETKPGPGVFTQAVRSLEQSGDTSGLKALAKNQPESAWGQNAQSLLRIHSSQANKIRKLSKSNKKLKLENRKLKETLEKLNRINLEMEKRSP